MKPINCPYRTILLVFLLAVCLDLVAYAVLQYQHFQIEKTLLQVEATKREIDLIKQLKQQQQPVIKEPEAKVLLAGYVSNYSKDGCLGCGVNQIMANGKPFDEDAMTLAVGIVEWKANGIGVPAIPLNREVLVENTRNGKQVRAFVTDTGGFNTPKYNNRIADLSKGLARALDAETDKDWIVIKEVI